ncbi:Chromosomal replication initiator protein DnaA [Bienertia sinuspersici]
MKIYLIMLTIVIVRMLECENSNGNPLEELGTNQQVMNADYAAKKTTNNGKKRGRNKCKEIAKLKPGEKLEVTFYNNRAVGPNHEVFARHLGIIVRDTNIVPVRVHKWKDIGDREKDHMWTAVTDVFSNENMESYREHVLDHMKELWINWRSDLLRYNVKNKNISLQVAYNQKPPNGLDKNDWRWLIKEVYSTDKFKKVSARNSTNRLHYQKELAHRTGSKPFRQVIWKDLGANKGIKPDLVNVFYTTRKKDNSLPNAETTQKYDEIREILEKDPSLPHVEVAQRVFKSKSRDRVVGFGGGIKLKDIKGPQPSREELEVELNTTKKQTKFLKVVWRHCKLKITILRVVWVL